MARPTNFDRALKEQSDGMIERRPHKWKCPTCRQWKQEPIAIRCSACRTNPDHKADS